MKHERIISDLLFYVDRLSYLTDTIGVLASASDIADAFQVPVELLRDTVDGLKDFHSIVRNECELEASSK